MYTSINPAPLTQPRRSREALPPPGSEWATLAPSAGPWDQQHIAPPPLMPLPLPMPMTVPQPIPSQSIAAPYPPTRPSYIPDEPPKQKQRAPKRPKRAPEQEDDDPPSSSQPTRSSNSNAARNARNAAARAERENRKHADGGVEPSVSVSGAAGTGRGKHVPAPTGSERGRSERGGSEIMPGDEAAAKGGGDRVAVGTVDGMRYHVSHREAQRAQRG